MGKTILAALVLASCSKPAPPVSPAADGGPEKVKVVSRGEGYSVADHLVPGHVTVLYFTADW